MSVSLEYLAKAGKPLVKVSPLSAEERNGGEKLGFVAGEISVPDDFDSLAQYQESVLAV